MSVNNSNHMLQKYLGRINGANTTISKNNLGQLGGWNNSNAESIFSYLHQKISHIKSRTKNKYVVILYGPPGSGKTIARNIACKYIMNAFNESTATYDTFVDTGVDEIIYESEDETGEKIKDKLVNNLKDRLTEMRTMYNKEVLDRLMVTRNISSIVSSSYSIYSDDKKDADSLSDLLVALATLLNYNIYFEISKPNINYMSKLIESLKYYDYIPVIIYPFINDVNVLFNRTIDRGMSEGRFLTCEGDYGLLKIMRDCLNEFKYIKRIMNGGRHCCVVYDANVPPEIFKELVARNYANFEKYVLQIELLIDTKYPIFTYEVGNFNQLTDIKERCIVVDTI
jgi:hypothetical protein